MKSIILDGRKTRDILLPELIKRVKNLPYKPTLAIIQVGDRADSSAYIRAKKNFAEKIGVDVKHVKTEEGVSQGELIEIIKECNNDQSIKGIIVQLPLPITLDRTLIINTIDYHKDVDGLTPYQVKSWMEGGDQSGVSGKDDGIIPATARGVRTLLNQYNISLFGKHVVVIGRSMLVGKPIIAMCLNENATVTVCHSKTPDLSKETKKADIIIVAAGRPGLITKKHINKNQVIVDIGINTVEGNKLDDEIEGTKLVGDVDFDAVIDKVNAITPVPGGVGPMTVISLFENLIDLCEY